MVENFCDELNEYLQQRFCYKKRYATCTVYNTIEAKTDKFDLYFRYKPKNQDILIIARIGFKEQKKGYGTSLLNFLSEVSLKHNINYIYIESYNKNSLEFGKKLGFEVMNDFYMTISTEDLILNLKRRESCYLR